MIMVVLSLKKIRAVDSSVALYFLLKPCHYAYLPQDLEL